MSPRQPILASQTVVVIDAIDKTDRVLKSVETRFRKLSTSIGNISLDLFRGGLVGTIPDGLALKEFQKFEDKILFLSTKLTATETEFKALEKTIRNLGKTTSFTASEVADGATVLAQAGFSAKEVTQSLQATLDLARGAQITLGQSGEILANTMRSFSMDTSKATEVASQFIAAARLGTLDVIDLKESIKEVLGTVRNLNIDLPTTLALLTQMAERSLKGTKAGTSLNTALLQMASKSQQLKKLFNIVLPENTNGEGFINFLELLYEKLHKLGNLKRTAVLQSIFNIRGGRAVTALDDIQKIIKLQKEIAKAGDEARKAAVKMDSGFGGSVRRASSAINDLTIGLGKLLAGPVTILLDKVPALSAGLQHLADTNPDLVTKLLLVPPAMLAVGAAGLTLSFALAKLSGVLSPVRFGITSLGMLLNKALTKNFIAATGAVKGLRAGAKGIDTGLSALLLTPELVGGKGRNARKVKPSSYFKRALLPGLGSAAGGLGRGALSIGRLPFRTAELALRGMNGAYDLGSSALRYGSGSITAMRRNARMSAREAARGSRAANAGAELNSAVAARDALTREYMLSVQTERRLRQASQALERQALDAVAHHDRHTNLSNMLRQATGDLATAQGTPIPAASNSLDNLLGRSARAERAARIRLLTARRTAIARELASMGPLPDVEGIIEGANANRAGATGESVRRRTQLRSQLEAARTRVVNATLKVEKSRFSAARRVGLATRAPGAIGRTVAPAANMARSAFSGIGNLLSSGGRGFVGVIRALGRIDWLANLNKAWSAIKLITFGFFHAANAVRRFVFSFGGILTIIELLLVFGSKIEFIRKSFERLANGFKDAFKEIGNIFSLISKGPTTLLSAGIGQVFDGNIEQGINSITTAFGAMATIVAGQLSAAWNTLLLSIEPVYDYLKKFVLSIFSLGELIAGVFGEAGAQLGNVFKLAGSNSGEAGQGIGGILTNLFSPETLKIAFKGIAEAITTIAMSIAVAINRMVAVVLETMMLIQRAILAIANGPFASNLGMNEAFATKTADSLFKSIRLSSAFDKDMISAVGKMDTILSSFITSLDKIFSIDTEKKLKDAKDTGKKQAEEAAAAALSLATGSGISPDNPLAQIMHGKMFPKTSIWATTSKLNPNVPVPPVPGSMNDPKLGTYDTLRTREKDLRREVDLSLREIQAIQSGAQANTPAGRAEVRRQRKLIIANQAEADNLKKKIALIDKFGLPGALQRGAQLSIQDIVATTVGDFASTRGNLLKVLGPSAGEKTNTLLNDINQSLGGGAGTPYLKQLLDNAEPLVLK